MGIQMEASQGGRTLGGDVVAHGSCTGNEKSAEQRLEPWEEKRKQDLARDQMKRANRET